MLPLIVVYVWFGLSDSKETLAIYPFPFLLEIGYRLEENSLRIMWKVTNLSEKEMHFSIGAHPAFDAPLAGIWSPPHKNAPFVCIEPWYGRCDAEDFSGDLSERDYEQHLSGGECFRAEYTISVSFSK